MTEIVFPEKMDEVSVEELFEKQSEYFGLYSPILMQYFIGIEKKTSTYYLYSCSDRSRTMSRSEVTKTTKFSFARESSIFLNSFFEQSQAKPKKISIKNEIVFIGSDCSELEPQIAKKGAMIVNDIAKAHYIVSNEYYMYSNYGDRVISSDQVL